MAKASEVLKIARGELGVKESPSGSNKVKYNTWYYGREVSGAAYPWCMVFVQWVCRQACVLLPTSTASCGALMNAARKKGMWVAKDFLPGDIVICDFPGGAGTDHTGIVERVTASGVVAIEGNTGAGNDADGGQVQRRVRANKTILGAVRPRYEKEKEEDDVVTYKYLKDVPETFRPCMEQLMNAVIIQGDGSDKAGNGDVIDLTHEQVRTLLFIYRGGGFDAKLRAEGLPTVVQ